MFKITHVYRPNTGIGFPLDQVRVVVEMSVKDWTNAKNKGFLGSLYGIDISNEVFHGYGVKAHNPTVNDKQRAKNGIKRLYLSYTDSEWIDKAKAPIKAMPDNVIRVDFFKNHSPNFLTLPVGHIAEIISIDFINKRRVA